MVPDLKTSLRSSLWEDGELFQSIKGFYGGVNGVGDWNRGVSSFGVMSIGERRFGRKAFKAIIVDIDRLMFQDCFGTFIMGKSHCCERLQETELGYCAGDFCVRRCISPIILGIIG